MTEKITNVDASIQKSGKYALVSVTNTRVKYHNS